MHGRALSSDVFGIDVDINGVVITTSSQRLFPAILSEELLEQTVAQLHAELAAVAVEAKAALRRQRALPLFD